MVLSSFDLVLTDLPPVKRGAVLDVSGVPLAKVVDVRFLSGSRVGHLKVMPEADQRPEGDVASLACAGLVHLVDDGVSTPVGMRRVVDARVLEELGLNQQDAAIVLQVMSLNGRLSWVSPLGNRR